MGSTGYRRTQVRVFQVTAEGWKPVQQFETVATGSRFPGAGLFVAGGAAAAGEVAYRVAEPADLGLDLLYNQRRFRLDDSDPAPQGVGEDNNLPLHLRLGWDITPQIALHLFGSVALGGEVRLEDRNGHRINKQDYDPAPYVGLRFVGGF
jgi:hypothetical protein